LDLPTDFAISIQWTALKETESLTETIRLLNLASNFDEFRTALSAFDVPSQNVVYADTAGNIGYQAPGLIPIRTEGNGRTPVPGWTGEYEWTGYIAFDELPFVYNPPEGYIVTANNAATDGSYPYLLTTDWNYGYRADRIDDLLNAASPVSPDEMAAIQFDSHNQAGATLVPYLTDLAVDTGIEAQAQSLLAGWDFQNSNESAAAAVFAGTWRAILADAFADELPSDLAPTGGGRWMRVTELALEQPDHLLWDVRNTADTEDRDTVLLGAFQRAVAELADEYGDDPDDWKWGELHGATFENQTLGQSGVGPVEMLFNRGPQPTGGGGDLVNATAWDASADDYSVTWVPSMRMVIDMGDLDSAITMHTTGQSGHAYSEHYDDFMEPWASGEYYPMWWERPSVEADAEGTLRLTP
jgi:penicillin amidase